MRQSHTKATRLKNYCIFLDRPNSCYINVEQLAGPTEGRKDLKKYWGNMMNGQPIPEALKLFIYQRSYQEEAIKDFIKEFEPIPNVSAYHDDSKKLISSEFEPIPNISAYHDDANPNQVKSQKQDASKKIFADEFEPIPNVTSYSD